MDSRTMLLLLGGGTVVYGIGYLGLLVSFVQGELRGLLGLVSILMATGIMIAMVFGVLLLRTVAEFVGDL